MTWLIPTTALAVVGTSEIDANTPGSPFSGVGSVRIGKGVYSGALVAADFVLTAAHVVAGHQPDEVRYQLNLGTRTVLLAAREIRIYPAYEGMKPGAGGIWHNDLALIRLAEKAPAEAQIYDLSAGAPLFAEIMFVGYGASGSGDVNTLLPGDAGTKRVGRNRIEQIITGGSEMSTGDVFAFRFDTPANPQSGESFHALSGGEANFAGGDSGAPVFVLEGQELKLAGLATFASRAAPQADVVALGGGTLLAPYQAWIEAQIRMAEPPRASAPWAWIGAGVITMLVLLGILALRMAMGRTDQ